MDEDKSRGTSGGYEPPFELTSSMLSLVSEISSVLGRLTTLSEVSEGLYLRRANRIKTIQGSLAIEGNTLSQEQITAVLNGKRVAAPPKEIQEARNAIAAYDQLDHFEPISLESLLGAHHVLMKELLEHPGSLRSGGVGVMAGELVIHMAPPADRVRGLLIDLLGWLKNSDLHPLVASCVFHYEFEFIHPFEDGNGRMGRLWQTLILYQWNPLFAYIPVESLVFKNQDHYYKVLRESNRQGKSNVFIEFMLDMILQALKSAFSKVTYEVGPDGTSTEVSEVGVWYGATPEVAPEVTPEVKKMLAVIQGEMSRKEIQKELGLKDEKHFRQAYQQPAVAGGLLEMTIPDKPNSRLQKYRITRKGVLLLQKMRLSGLL